jgi:hypothetical protein
MNKKALRKIVKEEIKRTLSETGSSEIRRLRVAIEALKTQAESVAPDAVESLQQAAGIVAGLESPGSGIDRSLSPSSGPTYSSDDTHI